MSLSRLCLAAAEPQQPACQPAAQGGPPLRGGRLLRGLLARHLPRLRHRRRDGPPGLPRPRGLQLQRGCGKCSTATILNFVRLVERIRRSISHEYGLPLSRVLPVQARRARTSGPAPAWTLSRALAAGVRAKVRGGPQADGRGRLGGRLCDICSRTRRDGATCAVACNAMWTGDPAHGRGDARRLPLLVRPLPLHPGARLHRRSGAGRAGRPSGSLSHFPPPAPDSFVHSGPTRRMLHAQAITWMDPSIGRQAPGAVGCSRTSCEPQTLLQLEALIHRI